MAIFESKEDADISAVMDTIDAATKAGFTDQAVDEGHTLCAKPDTMELVDIFPDGSWEYQNAVQGKKTEEMSGQSAVMLALYLSDKHRAAFADESGE